MALSPQITITVINAQDAEPAALAKVIDRARDHLSSYGGTASIYCNKREANGRLEYGLAMRYTQGGRIFVGCIERTGPMGLMEFHS